VKRVAIAVATALLVLAAGLAPVPSAAQEVSLQAGAMDVIGTSETSYSWQITYMAQRRHHLAWSVSWLNEGHPEDHHRDGCAPQLWFIDTLGDSRFDVGVGAGAYRYFDTIPDAAEGSRNLDAWGGIVSFAAGWRVSRHAVVRLTVNRTITKRDIQTHTYMLGLGWRLKPSPPQPVSGQGDPGKQPLRTVGRELMLFSGTTIVNTFSSESAHAWGAEYRHGFSPHFDWTLSWIDEGLTDVTDRDGIAGQVWHENGFYHERLVIGIGAGPYLYSDDIKERLDPDERRYGVASLITLTTGWRFANGWLARVSWNRVASFYNRDADVIVVGIGVTQARFP